MKILKYIAIIIAILIIGFLSLGLIKSEVSYDCETIVDKPLAESWAVTQDEAKMSEWMEGFQKSRTCQRYAWYCGSSIICTLCYRWTRHGNTRNHY